MNMHIKDYLAELSQIKGEILEKQKIATEEFMREHGIDPDSYDLYLPVECASDFGDQLQYLPECVKFHPLIKAPLAILRVAFRDGALK